MIMTVGSRG